MEFGPLTTTSVGSFPRPTWLAHTKRNQLTYRLEDHELKEAMDDAMALVIREQEELGLDLLTDGEMRRTTFVFHIAGRWYGVDIERQVNKQIYRNREANRMVPRIVDKIVRNKAAAVDDLRTAKTHTDEPIKVAVPGPMTVIDSSANEFYRDEVELAFDVAAALNAELRDLQAAGADVLQIDEPAMTRYHDKVRAYGAKALDRCLEGISVPTIVHLCYGYPGGGGLQHQYHYEGVLPSLMETRISGFHVEFGRSTFDPKVLKLCGDRIIMFGCIDPGDSPVPSVASVERRIGELLEVVDPKRVWLAPDCGLMTISREMAHDKLAVMVEAAKRLRTKL
jgi:5-methyltetrahydropteroyltriglutamate--homocysteine methyltransferase